MLTQALLNSIKHGGLTTEIKVAGFVGKYKVDPDQDEGQPTGTAGRGIKQNWRKKHYLTAMASHIFAVKDYIFAKTKALNEFK